MPVFVTHADTAIGTDLVRALVAEGADVRAFATGAGDVAEVRAVGAIVAVGDLDDEGHLEAAMTHAHTVVVPEIGWLADADDVATSWPVIVRAAVQAEVARIVVVSLVGARAGATVPVLDVLGRIEALVEDAEPQSLVVRIDGVVEADHADVAAALGGTDGPCRDAVMAPVARADLVAGLVALDAARSGRAGGHALFTAFGPTRPVGGPVDGNAAGTTSADRTAGPDQEPEHPGTVASPDPDVARTTLVGRRWMPPARRRELVRAICDREPPAIVGADLWELVR